MIKKEYKDYTIIIEEQKPSVPKPETEEQWDKHFETHGGETKGTHRYKVLDKEEVIINEDDTEMWDTQACLDNAMADIEEVILNSGDLTDYTMTEIIDDVELYVNNSGGTLE
jgi:hypothetical protein